MTLLITIFFAVICTVIWYKNAPEDQFKISVLCWMLWGASIMWFVDVVFEYIKIGVDIFTPTFEEIINDMLLGLSVLAVALVIWIAILLIKDPRNVMKDIMLKKKK